MDTTSPPAATVEATATAPPLRGWLICFGVGLALAVVSRGLFLLQIIDALDAVNWSLATLAESPGEAARVARGFTATGIWLVLLLAVLRLFLMRKRSFPRVMRLVLLLAFLAAAIEVVAMQIFTDVGATSYAAFTWSAVLAAIGIPYLRRSRRVKRTFVA